MENKKSFPKAFFVLIIFTLLTGNTAWANSLSGSGTQTAPYMINSVDDWNTFAGSSTYWSSGKYVKLGADIGPVTTMVGTSTNNCFMGVFDGSGHTLTLNLTHTGGGDAFAAPFKYLNGATIKRLHIAGTITTNGKMSAGIVGDINGSVTIQNCRSSVSINSSVNGDGTHGGFVGRVEFGKTLTITNCLFDGSMTGNLTNSCGGFVGWKEGSLTLDHCMQAGDLSGIGSTGGATFHRASSNFADFSSCYYKTAYGTAQGTQTSATGSDLQTLLGEGWEVNAQDIVVPIMTVSNLSYAIISGLQNSYFYFESPINIGTYTVRDFNNNLLTEGTHYTTELKNSSNDIISKTDNAYLVSGIDTYTLTVTAKDGGGYSGSKTFTFTTVAPQFEGVTTWADLKTKMAAGGYIRLDGDVTDPSPSSNSFLSVPSGKSVVLDLNSHTIDHAMTEATNNGYVIKIGTSYESYALASSLTVMDSGSGGKITGGWNSGNGGGVYISSNATLILNKGDISGNTSTSTGGTGGGGGGGVLLYANNSTFTMNGGSVSNNTAKSGCGIFMCDGTFNMTGGTISGNTANRDNSNGGGIYLYGGSINMSGGIITGNKATLGGGIYFTGNNLTVSGLINIIGNTKNDGTTPNNVYIKTLSHLVIGSYMDANALIGITSEEAPTSSSQIELTSGLSSRNESFLLSDNDAYAIFQKDNGEAVLGTVTYYSITPATCEYGSVAVSPTRARSGQTVTVTLTPQTDYAVQSVYYTTQGGTSKTYIPNNNGEYKFNMPAMNVTVGAEFKYWNTVNYTITYVNAENGVCGVDNYNPTSYTPQSETFSLDNPTRAYYIFGGWYSDDQFITPAVTTITQGSTSNKTFYAKWTPDFASYWSSDSNHDGSSDSKPHIISSTDDLNALASWVNSGDFNSSGKYFKVTNDIIYAHGSGENENNFTAIGNETHPFKGIFDGNGHTISGIRICVDADCQGLFGKTDGGTIQGVVLTDAVVIGWKELGGIVGEIRTSTIENCTVTSSVSVRSTYNNNKHSAEIGGVVGLNRGTIKNCSSSARLSGSNYYYQTTYTGGTYNNIFIGGIVGENKGLVSGCFAEGVEISFSIYAGAIIGFNSESTIYDNCYHACTVGSNTTGIGIGGASGGDVEGVCPVFTIITSTCIITTATAAVTHNGVDYYTSGTDITLSHSDRDGYTFVDYTSGDVTISKGTFTMPTNNVTVNATWRKLLTNTDITITEIPTQTYMGSALTPVVTVTDETTTLTDNSDYTITMTDERINAGNYTITITGINGYDGSVEKTFIISPAPLTITTGSDTKEYDGTPLTSNVANIEGLVNCETASIEATGSQTAVGESQNTYGITWDGTAVSTNYSIATENLGTLTVTPIVIANFGALTIIEDENGKTAVFDAASEVRIEIDEDIEVKTVVYNRTFTVGRASTVILPFDYENWKDIYGGTFYRFDDVLYDNTEGKWVVNMTRVGGDDYDAEIEYKISAHTPYLYMPNDTHMSFNNIVTLKSAYGNETFSSTGSNDAWRFTGSYGKKEWDSDSDDYGFAAVAGKATDGVTDIEAGQFVRFTGDGVNNAFIKPMRCYLSYVGSQNAPKRGRAQENLPQVLTVRLKRSNGSTTDIGAIDLKNGTFHMDIWYDLTGRMLDCKPSVKGIYIHNGQKVVIE